MIWILFYYNSLPEMPKTCNLFSPDIMHRDFFKCNPTNTNHYQYPKFETLSYDIGCHRHEVERILKRSDRRDMYIIFYTRFTNLRGESENRVVGYFKVGEKITRPNLGFKSSESVLLPRKECKRTHYSSRPVLVSWGTPLKIKIEISRMLRYLKSKKNSAKNIACKYQSETRRVMKQLRSAAGRTNIVKTCERCRANGRCYWGWGRIKNKETVLEKLYGRKHRC